MDVKEFQSLVKEGAERAKQLALRILLKFDEIDDVQEESLVQSMAALGEEADEAELNCEELQDLLEFLRDNKGEKKFPREKWLYALTSQVAGFLYGSTDFVCTARVAILCCLSLKSSDSTFFLNSSSPKKLQKYLVRAHEAEILAKQKAEVAAAEEARDKKRIDEAKAVTVGEAEDAAQLLAQVRNILVKN